MKKLIAILFISLLGLHFAPAFSNFAQQSAICQEIEEEKTTDKNKDTIKEKLEKKDFEYNRLFSFSLFALNAAPVADYNFFLPQHFTDIISPPPNYC